MYFVLEIYYFTIIILYFTYFLHWFCEVLIIHNIIVRISVSNTVLKIGLAQIKFQIFITGVFIIQSS